MTNLKVIKRLLTHDNYWRYKVADSKKKNILMTSFRPVPVVIKIIERENLSVKSTRWAYTAVPKATWKYLMKIFL